MRPTGRGTGPPRGVTWMRRPKLRGRHMAPLTHTHAALCRSAPQFASPGDRRTFAVPWEGLVPVMQAAADEARRARERDTLLLRASSIGDVASVERLLGEGASGTAACDQRRATPLHLAAARGHADVVDLLASHGGDVDAEDEAGRTGERGSVVDSTSVSSFLCADGRVPLPADAPQSCTWQRCVPPRTSWTCS